MVAKGLDNLRIRGVSRNDDDQRANASDSDTDLVAAARADISAFAALYRLHVDGIYRYCYRRLGSREAAEDATSQTFTQALEAFPRFHDGSFRAWLFTIAHNVTANALRSSAGIRAMSPLDPETASPARDPETLAIDTDSRSFVRELLETLPVEERRLIELRLAGLTGPEIARVVGRSHGAIRIAQYRAIGRLRERLLGRTPGAED